MGVGIVSSTSKTIEQSTDVSETINSSIDGAVDKFNQKLSGGKSSGQEQGTEKEEIPSGKDDFVLEEGGRAGIIPGTIIEVPIDPTKPLLHK